MHAFDKLHIFLIKNDGINKAGKRFTLLQIESTTKQIPKLSLNSKSSTNNQI